MREERDEEEAEEEEEGIPQNFQYAYNENNVFLRMEYLS